MKRKWIFLFSLTFFLLSANTEASYAYYEEPENLEENFQVESHEESYEEIHENVHNVHEDTNNENALARRLLEEKQKLSELSQNIDLKLPLDLELEQTLNETDTTSDSDTTEVKQSALLRKPAIKKEDQVDLTDEETQSLFPEESDEVSLSNSALLKPEVEKNSEYRTRKVRSR